MLTLQEMAPAIRSGLPRSGLVGLWDPYRDAYGRNCIGTTYNIAAWSKNSPDNDLTLTAGQADPFGGTGAVRIQVASNEGTNPCYQSALLGLLPNGLTTTAALWVKVLNDTPTCIATWPNAVYSATKTQADGWVQHVVTGTHNGTNHMGLYLRRSDKLLDMDCLVYGTQVNLGSQLFPYSAPVGAPGTLQTGTDYSGNGNTLTLGATTGASTDDPAFTGTAWSFDGGDYLKAADAASLDLTQFSCAVVFKRTRTGTTEILFDKTLGTAGAIGYGLYLCSASPYLRAYFWDTDIRSFGYTTDVSKDVYHCVTVSMAQGSQSMWLDGLEVATGTATWDISKVVNSIPLMVGAGYNSAVPNLFLAGDLPHLSLYNRPFTASEHAKIARTLKGMMTQRGLTPSW